ncbi:flagellin [Halocynthiibacter sp. C4]|uniref:flagellin n=1 Tax=Halocynthiibacter sp. C4 TaxID=2992758 RepID=UPI00237C0DCD|nr:flagellin [Halocynthiibacter sp. C4]MDE0588351.1 flagellin [Halocynthiibacter sp. C4]
MMPVSFGDRAHAYQLKLQNSDLKADLHKLSLELASGQVADTSKALKGNFASLASFEEAAAALEAYKTTNAEAAFFLDSAQSALGSIQVVSSEYAPSLLMASNAGNAQLVDTAISGAKGNLDAALAALNTRAAGQSIFAGQATNQSAVVNADAIIAELNPLIAGATTEADFMTVIDNWFDTPGGGFETNAYTGSTQSRSSIPIGSERTVDYGITALNPDIRTTLKGLTVAALVSDGAFASQQSERSNLLKTAGELLLAGETGIAAVRAEIGHAQNTVDHVAQHNDKERDILKIAKSELLGKDPYETAAELQATQVQLEALYTMTARISQLSLMDFLR